jgi:hypothetical protein
MGIGVFFNDDGEGRDALPFFYFVKKAEHTISISFKQNTDTQNSQFHAELRRVFSQSSAK